LATLEVAGPDRIVFDGHTSTRFDAVVADLEAIQAKLHTAGIRVNPSSRIRVYHSTLLHFRAAAKDQIPGDEVDLRLVQQSVHDTEQLTVIIEELGGGPASDAWRDKIHHLLGGSTLPQEDRGHTPGRDLQFELYTAALCSRAGCSVQLIEPDIRVVADGWSFSIAAKRPKSAAKLEHHIRKARKQIVKTRMDGIIALDLSSVYNAAHTVVTVSDPSESIALVTRMADTFIDRNAERIRMHASSPSVFGVMVFVNVLCYVQSTRQLGSASRWTFTNLCLLRDPRATRLAQFTSRFSRAYDTLRPNSAV
jgi:hypothetical protein